MTIEETSHLDQGSQWTKVWILVNSRNNTPIIIIIIIMELTGEGRACIPVDFIKTLIN